MDRIFLRQSKNIALIMCLILAQYGGCSNREEKEHNREISGDNLPGGNEGPEPTSFSVLFETILEPKCLGCHSEGNSGNNNVDLSTYESVVNSNNPSLVSSGNPNESLLYTVVVDGTMPMLGGALNQEQVELVLSWIEGGLAR